MQAPSWDGLLTTPSLLKHVVLRHCDGRGTVRRSRLRRPRAGSRSVRCQRTDSDLDSSTFPGAPHSWSPRPISRRPSPSTGQRDKTTAPEWSGSCLEFQVTQQKVSGGNKHDSIPAKNWLADLRQIG